MVHVPKANRLKLDPKSRKLIFVGYNSNVKGFRCIDPVTKKITISRDVVFFENPASNVKGFRCIDPVTKKITISRDVVFFENPASTVAASTVPASTVVAEELDDSDSVRDDSLGESSTNGTENINHGVISNDTLESADDRDDVEHTLVDDPDFEPDVIK
ncbi:hypothetical protein QE152_g27279 [Popillia japonica]|uniref:Retroviral polymerase SH3-like domain-containing protein n=1 Tax=Popillia japonica TaxID=7064 RepID=A0AAW1JW49_POPJA